VGNAKWSRESWALEVTPLTLRLKQPFVIASHTWEHVDNVFVTLRFASVVGAGEVSPDPRSVESVDSVVKQLEDVDPRELGNPFNLEGVLELLPPGAARCALDLALHDLAGKIAPLSVTKLLGLKGRRPPPTSVTVSIADVEAMVERARLLADHPILKTKVGFDGDVAVIGRIREVYSGRLRVDANEGWTEDEAVARLGELESFGIELCEQPIPAGNVDGLRRVSRSTSIPVFADEDVCTAAEVAKLAGAVDGVNLKLRKAGGIRETVRAIATARACELQVMIGCDLESGIATTAGAHVAPLADFVDLDGPLLLAEDPFPGVSYDRGELIVPDTPGLGVRGTPA
jgi:L-alanine-DL-glutamate epimerase-like enolase superfamily enzyme